MDGQLIKRRVFFFFLPPTFYTVCAFAMFDETCASFLENVAFVKFRKKKLTGAAALACLSGKNRKKAKLLSNQFKRNEQTKKLLKKGLLILKSKCQLYFYFSSIYSTLHIEIIVYCLK